MQVDIWSDVVCPWCYVGKRRFEAAVEQFEHGDQITVRWHSYELAPNAPREREGSQAMHLARKYGMTLDQAIATNDRLARVAAVDGLDMQFDRTRSGNTLDAHRLIHLGTEHGIGDAVKERFLRAYFTEGEPIGDPETLVRLGVEAGLDEDEARATLASNRFEAEVRADEEQATDMGISGVPFFVVDGKFGISGAQEVEVFVSTLQRAWTKAHPAVEMVAEAQPGTACVDDACDVPS